MCKSTRLLLAAAILFAPAALADDSAHPSTKARAHPLDWEMATQTGHWMQLQRSGQMAGSRYTIPGKIASRTYQRYLDSFKHPIPEHFEMEDVGGSGSSGTSSGR